MISWRNEIETSENTMIHRVPSSAVTKPLRLPLLLLSILAIAGLQEAKSAVVTSDWNLYVTGTYNWNTASNWSSQSYVGTAWTSLVTPGTVPNNGADTFAARVLNSSSGNVTVETSANVTIGRLYLERTSTGSTTLKLGGDMTMTGTLPGVPTTPSDPRSRPANFNNPVANTPGGLVLDLNGHTFQNTSVSVQDLLYARNYTLADTSVSGSGTFAVRTIGYVSTNNTGRVNVENNVTVKITDWAATVDMRGGVKSTTEGWNFTQGATFWLSGGSTGGASVATLQPGGNFGNFILGSTDNAVATKYNSSANLIIKGDLTYNVAQNGDGAALDMDASDGNPTSRRIFVAGSFTDKAATGIDYGGRYDGGITFNGGRATERGVWIARSGLTTVFQVGESNSIDGNIKLKHNLTTTVDTANTGRFIVYGNSRVNVDTFTLQASAITLNSGATVAMTLGGDSDGLIKSVGLLTLSSFNLELSYDGSGWTNGSNLLLFQYGSLTGVPSIASFTGSGITYGSLFNDGSGGIWLTNVNVVPEPSAVFLAVLGAGLLLRRGRVKSRHA